MGHVVVDRDTLLPRALVQLPMLRPSEEGSSTGPRLSWGQGPSACQVFLRITRPTRKLFRYGPRFSREAHAMNIILAREGLALLPSALHPLELPSSAAVQWAEQGSTLAHLRDALFDRGQAGMVYSSSARLFLPFQGDEEFGRLHAAVRLMLPLVPALAAASPFAEGRRTGFLDSRLEGCLHLGDRHPDLIGNFIPEAVFDQADYDREVLQPIGRVLGPLDPEGAVDYDQMNLRAAVAHFEHDVLELRLVDRQECASADVAVAELLIAVVKALVQGRWVSNYLQRVWQANDLLPLLLQTMKDGPRAVFANKEYLLMFGVLREPRLTAQRLWEHLYAEVGGQISDESRPWVERILREGPLASRMLKHVGARVDEARLRTLCGRLMACAEKDEPFI